MRNIFQKLVIDNIKKGRVAVYSDGRSYSFQDLYVLSSRFCSFLKRYKIRKGQFVILALFDSIDFIIVFLSCLRLGIIVNPVDPMMSEEEWRFILARYRPHCILATRHVFLKLQKKQVLKIADDDSSDYFLALLKSENESKVILECNKNDPALVLYTSGTTGRPKGIVHTYNSLLVDNFPRTILRMSEKDIVFSCSKLYTSFALNSSLLFPFHFGASTILSRNIPSAFSLQKVLELKPTLFFAVPSMYEFLLQFGAILKDAFGPVRLFISSGEKLYTDVYKKWKMVYGAEILECFGSSEMKHPFISNLPGKAKMDSCGKLVDGFKVKFSKRKRMYCRGPSMFAGYYGDKGLTKKKLIRGWFKSDDVGSMDEKGYVFISGRDNLVFKLNGKWVSILDIENKLRHCGVVKEIAVVKKQRHLVYYVTLNKKNRFKDHERKIRLYCTNYLNIHEFPKIIRLVDDIPKTRNRKINRNLLSAC